MKDKTFRETYKKSIDRYKENREKYLPIIESLVNNLIIAFLEPSIYYQNLKKMISLQIQYRTRYFLLGVLFFLISFYFIFFFLGFLFFSFYQLLSEKIQNHAIVALLVAWLAFLLFFIIIYISFHYFNKIGQKITIQSKNN
jgi:hypothetical protein